MEVKTMRVMQHAQKKMLREFFGGAPASDLSKRYGYSETKIKKLAAEYKQGKIDIFDNPLKRRINKSIMSHQEEVQLLKEKIAALEDALKMSEIKVEGYEYMLQLYKEETGIDLPKKVAAGQSTTSKKGTRK